MNKKLTLIAIVLLIISCSKDDSLEKELNNSVELEYVNFSSQEEMNRKIVEIDLLKEKKESKIIEKILLRNNVQDSLLVSSLGSNSKKIEFKFEEIEDDLKFYHRERLNIIYELRKELGFTSLQSIVDEINSLKVLDQEKANYLFNQYSSLINKSKYGIYMSRAGEQISNVLNPQGKVKVSGKLIGLNVGKNYGDNYDDFIDIDNGDVVGSNEGLSDGDLGNTGSNLNLVTNDRGYFINNIGDDFMVKWMVGKERDYRNIFYRYKYYASLIGYMRTSSGIFASYPMTINVGLGSDCKFKKASGSPNIYVNFRQTGTGSSFYNYQSRSGSFYLDYLDINESTFTFVAGGEVYVLTTGGISRNYDDYDPDNPVYD